MLLRLLLSCGIVCSSPAIASACINGVLLDSDEVAKHIKQAERLIAAGKYKKALQKMRRVEFYFDQQDPFAAPTPKLKHRATIVNASIVFRSGEGAGRDYVKTLQEDLKNNKDNPLIISLLAEGLFLKRQTAPDARTMLEDLATRELIPNAFGYVVLGSLRSHAGELESAKEAFASCRKMTKHRGICKPRNTKHLDAPWD